jgi:hypothetical protein
MLLYIERGLLPSLAGLYGGVYSFYCQKDPLPAPYAYTSFLAPRAPTVSTVTARLLSDGARGVELMHSLRDDCGLAGFSLPDR